MSIIYILLIMVLACMIGAVASLFMKLGSDKFIIKISYNGLIDIISNWRLILGIILYVVSAVIFISILKGNRLSFLYSLSSMTYIFTTILSSIILKESINNYKIIGIGFIILGVTLISL